MEVIPSTGAGIASAILALSKQTWKLGTSLSKLDQDNSIVNTALKDLADEVKSLGNECDLVYAELEEVVSKGGTVPPLPDDVDGRIWGCLVAQVEETTRTTQELDLFVKSVRGEESNFIGQTQRQRQLDQSTDQIADMRTKISSNSDHLHTMLLLINM